MIFNVPQYIDVEDKVAGPLTARQLGWFLGMGVMLFLFWAMFSKVVFYVSILPVMGIFIALAFYRPNGQSLIKFMTSGIRYVFGPKVYIWKRVTKRGVAHQMHKTDMKKKENDSKDKSGDKQRGGDIIGYNKEDALKNISAIAKVLDSKGTEADKDVVSILKSKEKK